MDANTKRYNLGEVVILCLAGILVNLLLNRLVGALGWPIYLDTIGTIIVAYIGGFVPGIFVALLTNIIGSFSSSVTLYYGFLNVLIAILTTYFKRRKMLKKPFAAVLYIFSISAIGGILGGFITWFFCGDETEGIVYKIYHFFLGTTTRGGGQAGIVVTSNIWAFIMSQFVVDVIDKAICALVAMGVIRLLPDWMEQKLYFVGWQQTPIPDKEIRDVKKVNIRRMSIRRKITIALIAASISIVIVGVSISLYLFRKYSQEQHVDLANGIAEHVVDVIDAEKVDDYIELGPKMDGYKETEDMLYSIKKSSPDIEYLYVYKIKEDGCHVVFDLDTDDMKGSDPGDIVPFDESFKPYMEQIFKGEKIDPIITNDTYGWLLTVYQPVYNKADRCVCYVGLDISMSDLGDYEEDFLMKFISLSLGFFLLILFLTLWFTKYHMAYPINAIAYETREIVYDPDRINEKIHALKELNITTGDEVENMYHTICQMTEDMMGFFAENRKKSELISKQQSSLIMLLADMVENRDESTGDHVKKTAAYVNIILRKLREKGYHEDILTDQYIADVTRSAPLHDIGKIQISDAILNKPGKLTDEEYEIMKTHTTAGAKIIRQAMETMPDSDYLKESLDLATYHHEKWNGKGYPYGLSGEKIPLSARVMAVADVFDALVSERVYKPPFPFEKAVEIIREDAGSHFDPVVAEAFLDSLDEVRAVANANYNMDLELKKDPEES